MIVNQINLDRFMMHVAYELKLPPTGVVLVTGSNGSGKSSFIEAVATAAFGKTLRGTSPWPETHKKGSATIRIPNTTIERTRKTSKKLHWEVDGEEPVVYETTTKAQAALETIIGPFRVWRQTHVFSSSDASNFSKATDAERKLLLETLLGIDWFDEALKLARKEHRAVGYTVDKLTDEVESEKSKAQQLEESLGSWREMLDDLQSGLPKEGSAERYKSTRVMHGKVKTCLQELYAQRREIVSTVAVEKSNADRARQELKSLGADGVCPKCHQDLPTALLHELRDRIQTAEAAAAAFHKESEGELSFVAEEAAELEEQATELNMVLSDMRAQDRVASDAAHRVKTCSGNIERDRLRLEGAQYARKEAQEVLGEAQRQVCEAAVAVDVFGLRGVRDQIIGSTLRSIENVANSWLERLTDRPMNVGLKSYSEKKSGDHTYAISFKVDGAGGGQGYMGASAGERRVIDIAILFALAEIALAAHNQTEGTLWLDEVLDSIHSDWVGLVMQAINKVAETRCVVVMSHNAQVMQALNTTKHVTL